MGGCSLLSYRFCENHVKHLLAEWTFLANLLCLIKLSACAPYAFLAIEYQNLATDGIHIVSVIRTEYARFREYTFSCWDY